MTQPKQDPVQVTREKLQQLQRSYDRLKAEQQVPTHARELTLKSLKGLINQLKEDLVRMNSTSMAK